LIAGNFVSFALGLFPESTSERMKHSMPAFHYDFEWDPVNAKVNSRKGIHPGKQRVFALELSRYFFDQEHPDFTEPFSRAEEIEFKQGDRIVKDIRVLEREDARGGK
jgi:hypothetical protein